MKLGYGIELRKGSSSRLVRRDIQRRQRSQLIELKSLYVKYMKKEGEINITYNHQELRQKSYTKIRNRCIYTGKSRGVSRRYRMSRVSFRELCVSGDIPGFRKSSW